MENNIAVIVHFTRAGLVTVSVPALKKRVIRKRNYNLSIEGNIIRLIPEVLPKGNYTGMMAPLGPNKYVLIVTQEEE